MRFVAGLAIVVLLWGSLALWTIARWLESSLNELRKIRELLEQQGGTP
jgi:hypothetical protein